MKHITHRICLVLSLLFVFLPLCSCSDELASIERGALTVDGKDITPQWVLKIDGKEVPFDEYRYFYQNSKTDLDLGMEGYFSEHPEDEEKLKETVLSYLTECRALEALADEHGITLSADELQAIEKEIAATRSELGDEVFAQNLNGAFLTESVFETMMKNNALYEKTYQHFIGEGGVIHVTEEELAAHLEENYLCYAQIYVDFRSGEGTTTHTKTDTFVGEIVSRLDEGEDFFSVAFSHSDDQTMLDYRNGYLKEKTALGEDQVEILSALKENEISEPLLRDDGYYIYLRMPISDAVVEENRDFLLYGYTDLNQVHTNGLYEDRFYELISNKAPLLDVEYCEQYDKISTETLS